LSELRDSTGETVHLAMFNGYECVYIDKVESKKSVRIQTDIGNTANMYCTALGKIILAFEEDNNINELIDNMIFSKYTKNTISNKIDLLKELKKIKKNGFAVDAYEKENDLCCIAAPIRDHSGRYKYSMSISSLRTRLKVEDLYNFKDLLVERAKLISKGIGY